MFLSLLLGKSLDNPAGISEHTNRQYGHSRGVKVYKWTMPASAVFGGCLACTLQMESLYAKAGNSILAMNNLLGHFQKIQSTTDAIASLSCITMAF